MKARGAVFLLAAGFLAGCGGSDGPSAKEKSDALEKWSQTADAACREANKAIAKRGWPVNLVDLDRLTVRAIADVQAASKTIRAQKPPAGSEEKVRPFVRSLEELDAKTKELSSATEGFKIAKLNRFLPEFGGTLQHVESAAKKLGLRQCATHQEHVILPDAVRAPVFAQQLADLDRRLTKRTKRLNASASTPKDAARTLRELDDIADTYATRLDDFRPPFWARKESDTYVTALRTLGTVFERGADKLADGAVTPGEASAYQSDLRRASLAERKALKRLLKDMGAVPTVPGGGGDEEAPAGDGEQTA